MDSDHINRWLTLGANVGVLIGIGLLIVELNQNSESMQIQIEQSRSESYVEWRRERASNDALAALDAKLEILGARGFSEVYEDLEPIERSRVRSIMAARFYDYENVFSQYERGFVSDEYWQERAVPLICTMAPFWKTIWGEDFLAGRRAFKEEIERILQEPECNR